MSQEKCSLCTAAVVMLMCIHAAASTNSKNCTGAGSLSYMVSKSWQSSGFTDSQGRQYCGLTSKESSPQLFQSAVGTTSADEGFHWFVVRLKEPVWISNLTIKMGGLTDSDKAASTMRSRAEGIEVWTSPHDLDFGSETCNSSNISWQFRQQERSWNSCERTALSAGESGAVISKCSSKYHPSRMMLLRKYVADIRTSENQCMSFGPVTILRNAMATSAIAPSVRVQQNSSVSVTCIPECPDDAAQIKLCHVSSNECLAIGSLSMNMSSAQPSDSGSYTCSVGDKVVSSSSLSVLYPPISVNVSVTQSSCSADSHHVTFAFESSAAEPAPHHVCSAADFSGSHVTLMMSHKETASANSVRSEWICENCSISSNLTVQCHAVQLCESDVTPPCSASDTALWNLSAVTRWNCSVVVTPTEHQERSPLNSSLLVAVSIIFVVIFVSITIVAAVVLAKKKMSNGSSGRRQPQRQTVAPATGSASLQPPMKTLAPSRQVGSDSTVQPIRNPQSSCTYESVLPSSNKKQQQQQQQQQAAGASSSELTTRQRAGSEVTVYLEILADEEFA